MRFPFNSRSDLAALLKRSIGLIITIEMINRILVSNDNEAEEASETDPILRRPDDVGRDDGSSSSCEIGPIEGNSSVANEGYLSIEVDKDSDVVDPEQPQCRICLDNEGEDLIAPCYCRGTQKYVHRSCLDHWRSTKEGFAFSHCTECKAVFILRANLPPDRWWLRLKYQFLVIRDHALIFIIVQLVVAFLGMLVYKFYGEELREMFGYEEHPYGFYTVAVLAILLVGLLYGFFIAIICGQRINQRHYHVLAKKELTKEYVVENREENKEFPELDPSHVTELRMLGLY
ncbi:hypothetical protein Sjap_023004 [Stephania japonica]|uniref:RING-CH-type domain-containing protein n=1 Tax=Stephania japonica TaxID=461633 RepID=A0AAP0ESZ2_9MAGN